MKIISFAAIGLVCWLSVTGCNKESTAGNATGDIVIGEFASMTGDTATFGISSN